MREREKETTLKYAREKEKETLFKEWGKRVITNYDDDKNKYKRQKIIKKKEITGPENFFNVTVEKL